MSSPITPDSGTEAKRLTAAAFIPAGALHYTTDQKRLWRGPDLVRSEPHTAADATARLGLHSSAARGCWPMDTCLQSDTGAVYLCIAANGTDAAHWQLIRPGEQSAVADISALTFSGTPTAAECEALRDACAQLRAVLSTAGLIAE